MALLEQDDTVSASMMLKYMSAQEMNPVRYQIIMECLPKILEKGLSTDILTIFEEFKKGSDDNPNQIKLECEIPDEMKIELKLKDFLNSILEMKEVSIEGRLTKKD